MGKFGIWVFRFMLGTLMFAAGIGPKDARSNVSAWLDVFGFDQASAATADFAVAPGLMWACALLIAVSFAPNIIDVLASKEVIRPRPTPFAKLSLETERFKKEKARIPSNKLADDSYYYKTNLLGDVVLEAFKAYGFITPNKFDSAFDKAYTISQYTEELMPFVRSGYIGKAKKRSKHLVRDGKFEWDNMSNKTDSTAS